MGMPRWMKRSFKSASKLVNDTNRKNVEAEEKRLRRQSAPVDMRNLTEEEIKMVIAARWL